MPSITSTKYTPKIELPTSQPSVHLKKEKGKSKNLQNSYTAHVRLHNCSQEKKSPI
jgi:hypothetical protein